MAFTVNFYSDQTARDSTAQPSALVVTVDCVWKSNTSLLAPSFTFSTSLNIYNLTYFSVPAWGRIYAITDVISLRTGMYEVSGRVDVLKTYKSVIGSSTQFISRSASAYNADIVDNAYPMTGGVTVTELVGTSPFKYTSFANGTYIIGITGTGTAGGVTYYELSPAQFTTLCQVANSTVLSSGCTIEGWATAAIKAEFDPFKYLNSAIWIPVTGTTGTDSIIYGPYDVLPGTTGRVLSTTYKPLGTIATFTLPRHPQDSEQTRFLRLEPYSRYQLILPAFGTVQLPADKLKDATSVYVTAVVDLITGGAAARVWASYGEGVNKELTVLYGQVGINMPFTSSNAGAEAACSLISTASNMLTGDYAQGLGDAAKAFSCQVSPSLDVVSSGSGGVASLSITPELLATFHNMSDTYNATFGRPYCAPAVISTLSGYVQTAHAHLHAGTAEESSEIESIMDGGFYYE